MSWSGHCRERGFEKIPSQSFEGVMVQSVAPCSFLIDIGCGLLRALLEEKASIPMVQQQLPLIQEVQSDEWWQYKAG
jgi:hypothetical protein